MVLCIFMLEGILEFKADILYSLFRSALSDASDGLSVYSFANFSEEK